MDSDFKEASDDLKKSIEDFQSTLKEGIMNLRNLFDMFDRKFNIDDKVGYFPPGNKKMKQGKIVGLTFNSIYGHDEYVVEWYDDGSRESYSVADGDAAFFKMTTFDPLTWMQQLRLPTGNIVGVPYIEENKTKECTHLWKFYQGFTDSFEYCEKCDQRKV